MTAHHSTESYRCMRQLAQDVRSTARSFGVKCPNPWRLSFHTATHNCLDPLGRRIYWNLPRFPRELDHVARVMSEAAAQDECRHGR